MSCPPLFSSLEAPIIGTLPVLAFESLIRPQRPSLTSGAPLLSLMGTPVFGLEAILNAG